MRSTASGCCERCLLSLLSWGRGEDGSRSPSKSNRHRDVDVEVDSAILVTHLRPPAIRRGIFGRSDLEREEDRRTKRKARGAGITRPVRTSFSCLGGTRMD
jgi:hypothetical protein